MKLSLLRFGIKWRRLIHKPLAVVYRLSLSHKINLIRNDFKPNGKPTVYAATHVFYDGIATVLCSLKDNAYLLLGFDGSINPLDLLALYLNGVILVDRAEKKDRREVVDKMVKILQNGSNILIFPESAWNLTPNLLVNKMHWGVIEVAELADANIVPVAINLVNDRYAVIIGESFDCSKYATKKEKISAIRDHMAAMIWELWEMKDPVSRDTLSEDYWVDYIEKQYEKMPKSSRKMQHLEDMSVFREKNEISLGELLAEMHGIEYRSMAADNIVYQRVERLIDNWTKPISFGNKE